MSKELFSGDFDYKGIVNDIILELRLFGETDVTPSILVSQIKDLFEKRSDIEEKSDLKEELEDLEDEFRCLESEKDDLEGSIEEMEEELTAIGCNEAELGEFFYRYIYNLFNKEIKFYKGGNEKRPVAEFADEHNGKTFTLFMSIVNNVFGFFILEGNKSKEGYSITVGESAKDQYINEYFPDFKVFMEMDNCFLSGFPQIHKDLYKIDMMLKEGGNFPEVASMLRLKEFSSIDDCREVYYSRTIFDLFKIIAENKLYQFWTDTSNRFYNLCREKGINFLDRYVYKEH